MQNNSIPTLPVCEESFISKKYFCILNFLLSLPNQNTKNDIDKWIFNLSNMETMETTLSFTNEIPLFKQLGKIASYSELSPEQQIQYDDSFNNYLAFMGQQEYKLKEGIRIGIDKGRAEAKISIARYLKSMGTMTLEQIAEATQLPIAEISKL